MSYMNGWGIPKDKPLAVRCFEIAGSWGDTDALAEAGFCYTQGVGCKKDLKKAAEFYRQAADKGMSMAGNSWYVFTHTLSQVYI
jgi:TPR repeat protein